MIGQTISHYKILEKLGEGGMGVVYKALDTKLDRTVALKFMPHHITPDDAESARFLQEAKAASALNHPNVCTIYGIHEEGGNRFIEMEYVEGRTMRQKLPVGTLGDAIRYGIQIGDALHEAHQKGIVHRDIKADNIMVNGRDQVKVMDFGLAKLKGSLKITKATSTVGTLAYMAPEQIQGSDVDARSDIFSFGVVLYEMLTGRLPFRNEHEAALMYSILNDEPDPIQKYLPELPPVLANLIHRALEKDRNDRHQSINEMVIELRRLQKQSTKVSRASLASIPVQGPAQAGSGGQGVAGAQGSTALRDSIQAPDSSGAFTSAGTKKRDKGLLVGVLAAVVVVGAAAAWFLLFAPSSGPAINPDMTFRTLEIPFKEIGTPSLSRDGGWVAFPGNSRGTSWDIYLMNTGSGEPRQMTTDSSLYMGAADLSPDGSQIVYDRADKGFTKPEIAVVSSLGGFSKRIVNVGFTPRWRPDGKRIAYIQSAQWGSSSGKFEYRSVNPNGSDDRLEFTTDDFFWSYAWSPDGTAILYPKRMGPEKIELFVRELGSGTERQLTTLGKKIGSFTWTQDGEIIFSADVGGNSNLWMVGSDGGTPLQVTRGSGPDESPSASGDLKRLLFTQVQTTGTIWLASPGSNDARQLTSGDANITDPEYAPDNRRIAYLKISPSTGGELTELLIMDIATGSKDQLLSETANIHSPRWSPDGRWIAYGAHADSVPHDSTAAWIIDTENQSPPRLVGSGVPTVWIDDRSFLTSRLTGTWVCTIDGAQIKRFFRDSVDAEPILNGTYILYSDVILSRKPGLWIEPAPGRPKEEPRELIKSLTSSYYEASTGHLYYITPQNTLRRMLLPAGKDEIVPGSFPDLTVSANLRVSPDGKRILWLDENRSTKLVLIENFIQ